MIYEYSCSNCSLETEITKAIVDFEREEFCNACGKIMIRAVCPQKVYFAGTKPTDAYFHPSLGQVVRGEQHAKQIAKDRKLIEVGNEDPSKHLKIPLEEY